MQRSFVSLMLILAVTACERFAASPYCEATCPHDGATRCRASSGFQVCTTGDDGCRFWAEAQSCPAGESCVASADKCLAPGSRIWTNLTADVLWTAVAMDRDDNIYAIGDRLTGGESIILQGEWVIAKHDPAGKTLWTRSFSGAAGKWHASGGIALDSAGNIIAVGSAMYSASANGDYGFTVNKYSPAGTLLWTKILARKADGETNRDSAYAVAVDASDDVFVGGSLLFSGQGVRAYLAKLAGESGSVVWEDTLSTDESAVQSIAVRGDAITALVGTKDERNIDTVKAFVRAYRGDKTSVSTTWTWNLPPVLPSGIAFDNEGNVVVTGAERQDSRDDALRIWTRKYSPAGTELWTRTLEGLLVDGYPQGARGVRLGVDAANSVVEAGYKTVAPYGRDYGSIRKHSASGELLWSKEFGADDGIVNGSAKGVAIDSKGDVVVCGSGARNATDHAGWLTKYSP